MRLLLGLFLIGFGLIFAYGWACWLLQRGSTGKLGTDNQFPERKLVSVPNFSAPNFLELALVTLGLSLGGLTLWMFWVAVILPGRLSLATALAGPLALAAGGLWVSRRRWSMGVIDLGIERPRRLLDVTLVCLVGLTGAAILFNSAYWPFSEEDALAIYAPLAKRIYRGGALPVDGRLYEAYPMLVPMAYAYTHWACGALNEYLARLIPGLLAVGTLGVTVALGRDLRSARAGWLAAALVGLTPSFCRWASSGYADVPASFYFTLSALFGWRWCREGGTKNCVLAGLAAGLALWTKNSALTLLATLPALVALRWWMGRAANSERPTRPFRRSEAALLCVSALAVAAPWYVRNLVVFDFLIPDAIWVVWSPRVRHDLTTLLTMTNWRTWSAPGWLFTASLFFGWIATLRQGKQARRQWALLLAYALPFYAAWWWMVDYDPRLLMVTTPVLAVMAALMLESVAEALKPYLPTAWRPISAATITVMLLLMAPFSLRQAVQHKPFILSRPWANDAEKHRVCLGGLYDLAMAVNRLPAGSRVAGIPAMSRYYVDSERLTVLPEVNCRVAPQLLSIECDYVVYKFLDKERPDWALDQNWLFHTPDGYWLCAKERVTRTQ
jgi:hypothetical protein